MFSQPIMVDGRVWKLQFFPKGGGHGKDTHISVQLFGKSIEEYLKLDQPDAINGKVILAHSNKDIESYERTFGDYSFKNHAEDGLGWPQFYKISDLSTNGFIHADGSLHLKFYVKKNNFQYRLKLIEEENTLLDAVNKRQASKL